MSSFKMSKLDILLESSKTDVDTRLQSRATILIAILYSRAFALTLVLALLVLTGGTNFGGFIGALFLNLLAIALSKAGRFRVAAYMVIVEPMIFVPLEALRGNGRWIEAAHAPLWMGLGPLIGSLVLSFRETVYLSITMCVSFITIIWASGHWSESDLPVQFVFSIVLCALSLTARFVQGETDAKLRTEEAKVVHSSKLASLGEMAAGIAHELNSPLAAISLNAECLEEELPPDAPEAASHLEKVRSIEEAVSRMALIIGGLKTFARETGAEPFADVQISEIVETTLKLCAQKFLSSGVELRVSEQTLTGFCRVQKIAVAQCLMSLLNNASYAVGASGAGWVSIDATERGREIHLQIVDSGRGIEPSVAEKMFNPFFTTKDYGQGTGLGLSVAKGILINQGGELHFAASEPNTTFVMVLPKSHKSHV